MQDPPSKQSSSSPSSPSGRPLSPLDVPELLEHILSYLSRYTLARTVIHVCREWLLLVQGRLHREVTWDSDWKPFTPRQALDGLPGAERLVIRSVQPGFNWYGPDIHAALQELRRSSSQLTLDDRYKGATLAGFNQPLRDIVLQIAYNFSDELKNTMPFPPSLTSLTIDQMTRFAVDVRRILSMCPLLESLHLLTSTYVYLQGAWINEGEAPLPHRVPLRSLVIQRFDTSQSTMEKILMMTPKLQDLQLVAMLRNRNGSSWDWTRFSKHIQSLSLQLKRFHFSMSQEVLPDDELQEATFSICPYSRDRILSHYDLTPTVVRKLTELPFFLTSLEILPSPNHLCHPLGWRLNERVMDSVYSARPLHQLLCESPSLRHLKTLKMTYILDFMDIHRRLEMYTPGGEEGGSRPTVALASVTPGIWICRDLTTLEVDVHFHREGMQRGAYLPRIVYGYISRVCPRLQDLRITFPFSCNIHIHSQNGRENPYVLEAGLCLLSRLVYLERLCVYYQTVICKIWELNWLCRSGRTVEGRNERRRTVDRWTTLLELEAVKERARLKTGTGTNYVQGAVGGQDVELMTGLQKLGLLEDVRDMVLEMDGDDFVCLPELYQLAVGRPHLEQTPEKEMSIPLSTTSTSIQTTLSPLDIPEILEQIFSYLDNSTLRRSIAPVCRQWFLLSQNRLVRDITWHESLGSFRKRRLLRKLPGAGRFYYCQLFTPRAQSECKHPFDKDVMHALGRLESAYRQKQLEKEQQQRHRSQGNTVVSNDNNRKRHPTSTSTTLYDAISPLREMNLYIAYARLSHLDTFTYPSSLTRLTIAVGFSYYAHFDICKVLRTCPSLEHFCAEGYGSVVQWSQFVLSTSNTVHQRQRKQQQPLRLRSLVLVNAYLPQDDLEFLLRFTPKLSELKLVANIWHYDKKYDWTRLFASLKVNNITLDKAHFSTLGNKMSAEEIESLWADVCPRSSSERSLWALDVTPQLLHTVFLQQDILTTLEVFWMPDKYLPSRTNCEESLGGAHELIHQYLCDSPYLAHLTTLKTVIRLKELDLFGRGRFINLDREYDAIEPDKGRYFSITTSGPTIPPRIWRCRGLRTLHVIVHLPDPFQPVFSRILFGYVARVCPAVEDLQICVPRACHYINLGGRLSGLHSPEPLLRLDGGFCLLGRLEFLQRLRVFRDLGYRTSSCEYWELDWIVTSKNGGKGRKIAQSRRKRQEEVESWKLWLANEERVEVVRCHARQQLSENEISSSSSGDGGSGVSVKDREVLSQLRNLGLLQDVEEMARELDEKEVRLMPSLERLSFNYPTLLRPEEELEQLFSK
ncbi:hypothetical protein EC957_005916 [Mortierella hygrophila]|uniref:F-box domain-containing protein n=1 Tax=Mortierella hygrophila TaxID=979708 RepID=A0A9P6K616_9FUNG|nr:hypothetical protein EC957_005916 [Mortierella hygrophila]